MANVEESRWAKVPWSVVAFALLISMVGVANLASAAQATRPDLFLVQLAWIAVAFVACVILVRIPTQTLELLAWPIYGVVVFLLVAVLVAGTTVKGATRWLDLGFFNLQPSELAKVAMILAVARYYARFEVSGGYTLRNLLRPMNLSRPVGVLGLLVLRWMKQESARLAATTSPLAEGDTLPSIDPTWLKVVLVVVVVLWAGGCIAVIVSEGVNHRRIVAPIDVVVIPFALVLIEPDLGTSLIVVAIAGVQILFCGLPRGSLAIAAAGGVATVVFGWKFLLKPYQQQRVITFLNPESDAQGAGYHSTQSKIAIGSGEFTGKGFGEGTQTQLSFLPENHTDFVFSVLAEEWGFIGGLVLILLFLGLLLLILNAAHKATERFDVLVNIGAAAMIFWHVLINIAMVTGLLPVVGMTLPLMSYGGSSMVTQMVAVALCINTAVWRRQ